MNVKINDSVKKMTLNADNRKRFTSIIIEDAFLQRGKQLRERYLNMMDKMADLTWGKTPQARAANKRRAEKILSDKQELESKGIDVRNIGIGHKGSARISVNAAGQSMHLALAFKKNVSELVFNFDLLMTYDYSERSNVWLGNDLLTLDSSSPLLKELNAIRDEYAELNEAKTEMLAIINTVLGKSKTLGNALDKWEGLSIYVPKILSASKEIVVAGPVIDERLKALRESDMPVSDVMKIGAAE